MSIQTLKTEIHIHLFCSFRHNLLYYSISNQLSLEKEFYYN